MQCPICFRSTAGSPCECGYDFETGDRQDAADRALVIRTRSASMFRRGLGLLISMPVTIAIGIALPSEIIRAVLFSAFPIQLLVGVGWTVRGFRFWRTANHRLDRATKPAELPPARIV